MPFSLARAWGVGLRLALCCGSGVEGDLSGRLSGPSDARSPDDVDGCVAVTVSPTSWSSAASSLFWAHRIPCCLARVTAQGRVGPSLSPSLFFRLLYSLHFFLSFCLLSTHFISVSVCLPLSFSHSLSFLCASLPLFVRLSCPFLSFLSPHFFSPLFSSLFLSLSLCQSFWSEAKNRKTHPSSSCSLTCLPPPLPFFCIPSLFCFFACMCKHYCNIVIRKNSFSVITFRMVWPWGKCFEREMFWERNSSYTFTPWKVFHILCERFLQKDALTVNWK